LNADGQTDGPVALSVSRFTETQPGGLGYVKTFGLWPEDVVCDLWTTTRLNAPDNLPEFFARRSRFIS